VVVVGRGVGEVGGAVATSLGLWHQRVIVVLVVVVVVVVGVVVRLELAAR